MRLLLIIFLLFPALSFGQTKTTLGSKLTVVTPEPVKQPAGTIRSVSMGTETSITYYNGPVGAKSRIVVINPEPLQYKGIDGKYTPFDLTEKPAVTAGYKKRVVMGLSVFEYDSTGRQRYEKQGSWFETAPLFTGIETNFVFSTTQQKVYYTLTDKSPRRMAWSLTDPHGIARRKIAPFVAWDAEKRPVEVKTTWFADSLVVDVLAAGWVLLDPTVIDTAIQMNISGYFGGNSASPINETNYNNLRNRANAGSKDNDTRASLSNINNSVVQLYRTAVTFPYPMAGATGVDSAFFVFEGRSGIEASGYSDTLYVVEGTWTGPPDTTKFNDFTGWTGTTGAYPVVEYTDRFIFSYPVAGSERRDSVRFNAAGRDSLLSKMQRGDSLRVMIMSHVDVRDRYAQAAVYRASGTLFYYTYSRNTFKTIVYYSAAPPTVVAVADTTLPVIRFVATASNATVRGVKYWPSGGGAGDTVTRADTGSHAAGVYLIYSLPVRWNTTYLHKYFSSNAGGMGYSAIDSVVVDSIGTGGGTPTIVDGREVDTWR